MTKKPEESVARIERWLFDGGAPATNGDLIDLIASWRERGEALKECHAIARELDHFEIGKQIADAIFALRMAD